MPISPRKSILAIKPYRGPCEGRYGRIRLDFNENTSGFPYAYPQDMPPEAVSAYPEYGKLTKKLSDFYKIEPESLLLTNGSDEALLWLALTFIEPDKDRAVVSQPCFAMMVQCLTLASAVVSGQDPAQLEGRCSMARLSARNQPSATRMREIKLMSSERFTVLELTRNLCSFHIPQGIFVKYATAGFSQF